MTTLLARPRAPHDAASDCCRRTRSWRCRACPEAGGRADSQLWTPRRELLLGAAALAGTGLLSAAAAPRADAFIQLPSRLHNRYILVRHGESVLEQRGLLMTSFSTKYDITWSLTERGRRQMADVAAAIAADDDLAPAWLYTSNFQRAFQSALILREDLGMLFANMRFEFSGLLDPRKLGALDGGPMDALQGIWDEDQRDTQSMPPPVRQPTTGAEDTYGVESAQMVYRRALEAFTRLEANYFGADIVLVSHGDTLSIFASALAGTPLETHHRDHSFALGEYRVVDMTRATEGVDPRDLRGSLAPTEEAFVSPPFQNEGDA